MHKYLMDTFIELHTLQGQDRHIRSSNLQLNLFKINVCMYVYVCLVLNLT